MPGPRDPGCRVEGPLISTPLAGGSGPEFSCSDSGPDAARHNHGRTQPVSLLPCSVCRKVKPGKLASAYWAWFNADGERIAWKMRYCLGCAPEALNVLFSALQATENESTVFDCVSCGSQVLEDSDPIFVTLFLPGQEAMEHSLQLDGACAAQLRIPITLHGTKLENRPLESARKEAISAWSAIGIEPRQSEQEHS